jgi:hypothetical protein
MNGLFFELLQIAIGNRKELTRPLTDDEWGTLYAICEKQALLGIAFAGVERLPKEQFPPFDVLAEWVHDAQVAKEWNKKATDICEKVCRQIEKDGFWVCVLKGQANLPNYPEYLRNSRTCGDIDIWIWPLNLGKTCGITDIINYSVKKSLDVKNIRPSVRYNNTELPGIWPIDVEIHHRPSFMNCFYRNARLQRWCKDNIGDSINIELDGKNIPVAKNSFNAIYQLSHIYCHLFDEGIGLRQILDYYMVLRRFREDGLEFREESLEIIGRLGMKKFASAMMYVLQTVFAMPDEYLICKPNEREGRFLLNEIIQAGNFGKYDERIKRVEGSYLKVQCNHAFEKLKHNLRLIAHYPEEVLWEPLFRLYHFVWRKCELWKV